MNDNKNNNIDPDDDTPALAFSLPKTEPESVETVPDEITGTDTETDEAQNEREPEREPERSEEKRSKSASIYDYVETFCYAVALMIVLFMFVFRYVTVVGESMLDTLQNDDKLIISNMFYTPQTGDIIVIRTESKPLIKRVIAAENQTVKIDFNTWEVWVDGEKLDQSYITRKKAVPMHNGAFTQKYTDEDNICEFTVEKGKVFVMGDNRNDSSDSRAYEPFEYRRIIGHVIVRVFPNTGAVG